MHLLFLSCLYNIGILCENYLTLADPEGTLGGAGGCYKDAITFRLCIELSYFCNHLTNVFNYYEQTCFIMIDNDLNKAKFTSKCQLDLLTNIYFGHYFRN